MCKNGSDKPNDDTIRLTLVRSPGADTSYTDQSNQDWGHHEIVFGLAGHKGDWREGQTDWQAYRLNAPLIAFETGKHAGSLGKEFSLLKIDNPRIRVMALKKAENSDEVILRMVEMDGKADPSVKVTFAGPIAAAREVNGQEQPVGAAHGRRRRAGNLLLPVSAAHLRVAIGRRSGKGSGGAIAARHPNLRPGRGQQ